jgi:hypothetical protein
MHKVHKPSHSKIVSVQIIFFYVNICISLVYTICVRNSTWYEPSVLRGMDLAVIPTARLAADWDSPLYWETFPEFQRQNSFVCKTEGEMNTMEGPLGIAPVYVG